MRRLIAVGFLLIISLITASVYGQKTRLGQKTAAPNPADFTLKVHISATHIRADCTQPGSQVICGYALYADSLLNGKKLELRGTAEIIKRNSLLIIPGDYQARVTKDLHNADSSAIAQEYDVLLTDNTVWHCVTSGISE